ncbi:Intradiol ring-cleavage dioxygenase [Lactarius sanguifluus]|nr:Intradiol ring-cleavage dioxygenase [Lactarius sanguifluus]
MLYRTIIAFALLAFPPSPCLAYESVVITKLHEFVNETQVTPEEWMTAIEFLTRTGQMCAPFHQKLILLSDVLGGSVLVDALNNPPMVHLIPFATPIPLGESSEGKGEYLYAEGHVCIISGVPIPGVVIETWEANDRAGGFYDTQYADCVVADCRASSKYGYRAIVPIPYPIPGDGPMGDLLLALRRHIIHPNHLHMMIDAPTSAPANFRQQIVPTVPCRRSHGDTYQCLDVNKEGSVSQAVDDAEEWSWEEVTEDHGDGDLDGDNVDDTLNS